MIDCFLNRMLKIKIEVLIILPSDPKALSAAWEEGFIPRIPLLQAAWYQSLHE